MDAQPPAAEPTRSAALDRALLALIDANRALQLAHVAARDLGDADLAAYIGDLGADVFSTLSEVAKKCSGSVTAEAVS